VTAVSGSRERHLYLVECYWPGVTEQKLTEATARAGAAARELQRHGRDLKFPCSILVPADETVFCFFDGAEEDVRAASSRAGVPFERALESLRVGGMSSTKRQRPSTPPGVRPVGRTVDPPAIAHYCRQAGPGGGSWPRRRRGGAGLALCWRRWRSRGGAARDGQHRRGPFTPSVPDALDQPEHPALRAPARARVPLLRV